MGTLINYEDITNKNAGIRRTSIISLPEKGEVPIFRVSGGMVKVLQIIGRVREGIQTKAKSCTMQLCFRAFSGHGAALCDKTEIRGDKENNLYGLTGNVENDMIVKSGAFLPAQRNAFFFPEGELSVSTSSKVSGVIQWDILFVPVDPGAFVEVSKNAG